MLNVFHIERGKFYLSAYKILDLFNHYQLVSIRYSHSNKLRFWTSSKFRLDTHILIWQHSILSSLNGKLLEVFFPYLSKHYMDTMVSSTSIDISITILKNMNVNIIVYLFVYSSTKTWFEINNIWRRRTSRWIRLYPCGLQQHFASYICVEEGVFNFCNQIEAFDTNDILL